MATTDWHRGRSQTRREAMSQMWPRACDLLSGDASVCSLALHVPRHRCPSPVLVLGVALWCTRLVHEARARGSSARRRPSRVLASTAGIRSSVWLSSTLESSPSPRC